MGFIRVFFSVFVQATSTLLLLYCVFSWFLSPDNPIQQWLGSILDPILDPIRSLIPGFGMIDISPIILMLILQFIQRIINGL